MAHGDAVLLVRLVEAVLFLENRPVNIRALAKATGQSRENVKAALANLNERLIASESSLSIIQNERGDYYLTVDPELYESLGKHYDTRKKIKLSKQALETLSIIAYKQPVTRVEIEKIRGVGVDYVLRILLEYDLVKVVGRKSVPGRPVLYGTTGKFLQYFGLLSLRDLPSLAEFERT